MVSMLLGKRGREVAEVSSLLRSRPSPLSLPASGRPGARYRSHSFYRPPLCFPAGTGSLLRRNEHEGVVQRQNEDEEDEEEQERGWGEETEDDASRARSEVVVDLRPSAAGESFNDLVVVA